MIIANSLTKQKEELVPIENGKVRIYACGPTVYNYFHLGNARPFIVFDTLRRYLKYRGYEVQYVQNFTDVDDKMITAASLEGVDIEQLANRYIDAYFEDAKAINIKRADIHPRATEHIKEIIDLIQRLIDNRYAYNIDGDVYFDVASFPDYGKLSGQSLEDLESGHRIEINSKKRNPGDFALWKAEKFGEISWDSPWGKGRPGWHIECSAMSMKYLGDTIDIHGGGEDLKFPHHENEIAQSEAATGKPFVKYWIHNGYININGEKMAKSKGNFFMVRDILKNYDGVIVRLFMLSSHYATPINYSTDLLDQNKRAYERIQNCRENLKHLIDNPGVNKVDVTREIQELDEKFNICMDDDLNTAGAIGAIFEYIKTVNTLFETGSDGETAKLVLEELDSKLDVLGLLREDCDEKLPPEIEKLAKERQHARENKNWEQSDSLRDKMNELGYEIKDTPQGAMIKKI